MIIIENISCKRAIFFKLFFTSINVPSNDRRSFLGRCMCELDIFLLNCNAIKPSFYQQRFCLSESDMFEFHIVSLDNKQWLFEAASAEEREEWVCAIEQQILNSLQVFVSISRTLPF